MRQEWMGAVCTGCYPRCHMRVFVESVMSWPEGIVKARGNWATVARHIQIKGKRWATVAWHLPGLGMGIYDSIRETMYATRRNESLARGERREMTVLPVTSHAVSYGMRESGE